MQNINNILIKNFKSIRQAEIKDCRRVNFFIGYPNVGKSNVLEALGIFSIDGLSYDFSHYVRMEAPTTLFFNGDITKCPEIRINNTNRYIAEFTNYNINFYEQYNREETSFEISDGNQFKVDETDYLLSGDSFKVSNSNSKNNISDFRTGKFSEKKHLVKAVKRYSYSKHSLSSPNSNGYTELATPLGSNLFNVILANKELKKDVEELFELYNLKFSFDYATQSFTILKFVGKDVFTIPYSMVADTLRRLIFHKAAIFSNKDSIIVFEEPEAHFFPPYISKLTNDIMHNENNNQYFIATHSPFVLNDFMEELDKDDLSIYAVGLKDGETIIRRLSDDEVTEIYQYGVDLFFNLENYLKDVAV